MPSSPTSLNDVLNRINRWGNAQDPSCGDVHFYNYDDDALDPRIYPEAKFVSEFGYQASVTTPRKSDTLACYALPTSVSLQMEMYNLGAVVHRLDLNAGSLLCASDTSAICVMIAQCAEHHP